MQKRSQDLMFTKFIFNITIVLIFIYTVILVFISVLLKGINFELIECFSFIKSKLIILIMLNSKYILNNYIIECFKVILVFNSFDLYSKNLFLN